ncbi:MAG: ABC transporter permease [Pseudobdellovibrio sp.]
MKGLQRKLIRDFKMMFMQVITIALLIMGGVSVLVSSWSSYQSLQRARDIFYDQYHFADVFSELVRAPQSIVTKISELKDVELVESRIIKDGLVEVNGQVEPALGRFISWSGNQQQLNLVYLRQGRMPQPGSNLEIVVHESFAISHKLKLGDSIKVLLNGQQKVFIISGIVISPEYVYALSPIAPLPDDKHFGIFWLRQKDLEELSGLTSAFNSLQIKVSNENSINEIKRQVDLILGPYGNIQSYDRSRQLSNLFVEDEIRQQKIMAIVMPSVFLAVAMFILNVIISRLIALDRAKIATLKSLGYGAWSLTIHYFQLVTLILLVGTIPSIYIGSLIGKWYAGLYQDFFRFPSIDFSLSLSAVIIGLLAGLVPGWIGAAGAFYKVFSLKPAEALRPPSPPEFHKGLFDLFGLTNRLGIFAKMTLRSLTFRPLRLVLSILGIAAALAILINGSFWTDVIDFMMNRQFYEMQREDLTVRLAHPKSYSVYSELNQIPGVIMTEGERSVPVRLQFKNYNKDLLLIGWNEKSQLSRVMDNKGHIIQPIAEGILLSRYFETKYNIRSGDKVHMKVLQGTQTEFSVLVMGFVDDLVGQQAYALNTDLHRWLKEQNAVDSIQLKIDPAFAEKIYVNLKEKPEVVAVSIRRLMLKSFNETVASMILTFTFILYIFAIGIAGSVIYNSVRIEFSEKGWELASLRILGFDVWLTFELLFIEIGFQVFLALIPGLLLGYWLSFLSTNFIHNDTFSFPLVINSSTYAKAVLLLLFTFIVSGLFLYQKVKQLNFSDALKARE